MNDVDRRDVWAQLTRISLITLPALLVFMVFDQAPYLFDTFNRGQVFGRDAHNLWIAGRILLEERSALAIYDNDRVTGADACRGRTRLQTAGSAAPAGRPDDGF